MATMKAMKRSETGTKKVHRLRKNGLVPAILYGHGEGSVAISLQQHDLELAILHGERLIEIDLDGKHQNCLLKDVQYDAFGSDILHVDLGRVDLDEQVKLTITIMLVGEPAGAKDGGVLQQAASEVEIECPVRSIPDEIKHVVTPMNLNDKLYMRELTLPEGATLLSDPETVVAGVAEISEVEEEKPAEGEEAAEPEVIGAKPAEEDAEEE